MLSPKLQLLVTTVVRLLRRGHRPGLEKVLRKQRAEDVAVILDHVIQDHWIPILQSCPDDDFRGEVIGEAELDVASELIVKLEPPRAAELLQRMSPDDVADILGGVSEEIQQTLLELMKDESGEEVEGLLTYDDETAGGIMNPVFFALHRDTAAREAINELQQAERVEMVFYIYVVNDEERLVGVISLRDLVTHKPETKLSEIMVSDVISVAPEEDQEEVARLASRYGFLAIPVVDSHQHLLGIVTIDDVIDVIREEATEDILKMAGAASDLIESSSPIRRHVWSRVGWLVASAAGGLIAATLLGVFEKELTKVLPLAFFLPVVIGMGGNIGTQSSTIVVRGLAMGRIDLQRLGWVVGREIIVGLILGLIYGTVVGVFSYLYFHAGGSAWSSTQLGLVVSASVLGSMTLAAGVGSSLPLLFQRINIDPAVATGPFVTTAIDLLGVLLYFNVAKAIIPL